MSNSVPNFFDISYLKSGTRRQQMVWLALEKSQVLERLKPFDPVLAGTFPIDLDIETSDLDILCEFNGPTHLFAEILSTMFDDIADTVMTERNEIRGVESVICRFDTYGFEFEIFGQPIPVREQMGYLPMLAEARLLALSEAMEPRSKIRDALREMKRNGEKTEPAFAKYFNLPGDPYLCLKSLAYSSDEDLREIVSGRGVIIPDLLRDAAL
jgi:hypothetical protein